MEFPFSAKRCYLIVLLNRELPNEWQGIKKQVGYRHFMTLVKTKKTTKSNLYVTEKKYYLRILQK